MTEPFISPWLIYLVQVCGNLGAILGLGSLALGASRVVPALIKADAIDNWDEFCKVIKLWLSIFIICSATSFLIPSKETATAMLIASKATPANYDAIKQEIIGLVGEIKKETE